MTTPNAVQTSAPACFTNSIEPKMVVRVWLEVGHACEPRRSPSGHALALDWRVWVRGVNGADISSFVDKVVFHLQPSSQFVYPKRVIQEPPYEIHDSGPASIEMPIDVYLKHSSKPRRIRLQYRLLIVNSAQCSSESRCICYDVEIPSGQLRLSLLRGGGEVIARTDAQAHRALSQSSKNSPQSHQKPSKRKMYEFVEPIQKKPAYEKKVRFDDCSKCDDSRVDFKSILRGMSMTKDEIKHVSQLYLSYSSYKKSSNALQLPPLSDPIYRMPELPALLRRSLTSVEVDYALQ